MTKRLRARIAQMKLRELMECRKLVTSPNTAEAMKGIASHTDLTNIRFDKINESAVLVRLV